jgi:prepilin-type processing-associated H-X9-DG protein
MMGESWGSGDVQYGETLPVHHGGAHFGFFDGHARWYKVTATNPKCTGLDCGSDIDPDPFYAKWRYREEDPITRF